ncbi:MAG: preprotein translocase subunit SecE [Thermodesulfovibrionales bacterium]
MIEKVKVFFGEVKAETKKVTYPDREELIGSTWVVITTVVIISAFLGLVDMGLARAVKVLVG